MRVDCGEVGGDGFHAGGAARRQIAGDGGQAFGMAGHQQEFLVIGCGQAGNLLRDLRGRSEDYDFPARRFVARHFMVIVCMLTVPPRSVMRRQNPDDRCGSTKGRKRSSPG